MITAGLDLGTRTVKAVILDSEGIIASEIAPVNDKVERLGKGVLRAARKKSGLSKWCRLRVCATGYGRRKARVAHQAFPDSVCLARAMHYLDPQVRTVLDVGGLMTRGIRLGKDGFALDYLENDRCASGSGRFLELVAEAMELPLEKIGPLSLESQQPLTFTSQCVVFAESEVISQVNSGESQVDILAGLHRSVAMRVTALARKLGGELPVAIVGGVAKNTGVVHFLELALNARLHIPKEDPQIIAALGAALLARGGRRRA